MRSTQQWALADVSTRLAFQSPQFKSLFKTQASQPTTSTTPTTVSVMSVYTKFAIIGAGSIGGAVADELPKKGATVSILTRDDTQHTLQAFFPDWNPAKYETFLA
ncbi:hypothetical protein PC129_g13404 [Phytophthora cactorum]|uniref:Ketopantoate reductase N-terminal domain-containing protein n=1 Tax=Phytophthora cactorum TaxID=29920 RepID=A0A8T1FZI4_9STRA|nr:hypothetical protein PC111_g3170 [Phytophthora cactorum]KAG2911830.1 hypothetical protein PC114_g9213 [Phytophthora cactorum]KAG2937068.1 hypothetical protein PC115_g4430 [Phytophthora cactorum]KAG2979679.1 hypothetical protein PC118_g11632 [Phytophthora cactorum]KAG3004871.1 hypothetical protein PC120_g18305 [Phytophthora cactorum]